MNEDAELIERYLGGEKLAGSLLVARHSNALFCWLRWKTGKREDAEDLTQLVWMRAFSALERLEDRAALRTWLFAIMRREFTHWLRDHRAEPSLEALGDALNDLAAAPHTNALHAVEDRLALQTALAQLSEEHRDTFMLCYLSQFTAPEAAQILEVPVGTVESRCHFARQRLRAWMLHHDAIEVPQDNRRPVPVVGAGSAKTVAAPPAVSRKPWYKGHLK